MGTALQLQRAAESAGTPLQVIGIPKTIDNDLLGTDHTPGYISTATFFAHAVRDIGADNRSLPGQVEVIEVLGRNVGWIAAATSFAKSDPDDAPHLVYLPENRLPLDKLLHDVDTVFQRLNRCVLVVCEGQLDERGEPFGADVRSGSRGSLAQNLGHRLSTVIAEKLKIRARSEKPGLLGRCTSAFLSKLDWEEARRCGEHAVRLAAAGQSGVMVNLQRNSGTEYASTPGSVPLAEVAFVERLFPSEWITPDRTGVTPSYRDYAAPIIQPLESYARLR
jgi:6-phosphofructokinase 1